MRKGKIIYFFFLVFGNEAVFLRLKAVELKDEHEKPSYFKLLEGKLAKLDHMGNQ